MTCVVVATGGEVIVVRALRGTRREESKGKERHASGLVSGSAKAGKIHRLVVSERRSIGLVGNVCVPKGVRMPG